VKAATKINWIGKGSLVFLAILGWNEGIYPQID